ncbi:glucuronyl hydrolase [Bacteroidia bacterium]|nr:glucuronyl hydrolase [Bacteroidia bacterium]
MKILNTHIALAALLLISCNRPADDDSFLDENIAFAREQVGRQVAIIEASGSVLNPVTLKAGGSIHYCDYTDWRSGFFPGTTWYLHELSNDTAWLPLAQKYTLAIEEAKRLTWHHDVGFIISCSFGNAFRLTGNEAYKDVIIEAAKSLSTRFIATAGVLQSWNVDRGWQSERGWECPVIIDNMMNLELLFNATRLSGDSSFYKIAVSHADRTLAEQFRPDGSCFHVVDYNLADGSVRNRHTAQGYAHHTSWSRGQAWAIYGYTICYRETGDPKYIRQALKTFRFMQNHKDMPPDLIPYWDMDAPNIPNEYRDVSSAACMASALYEISTMDVPEAAGCKQYADSIMQSLSSPSYRAAPGTNGNFILMHSVGSIPHKNEIDVPLNYADYYFLEALKRKKDMSL